MADQFDRAQELADLETTSLLNLQQKRAAKAKPLEHTGDCLNPLCGEPVDSPRLFCGIPCAQEHARRSK